MNALNLSVLADGAHLGLGVAQLHTDGCAGRSAGHTGKRVPGIPDGLLPHLILAAILLFELLLLVVLLLLHLLLLLIIIIG